MKKVIYDIKINTGGPKKTQNNKQMNKKAQMNKSKKQKQKS